MTVSTSDCRANRVLAMFDRSDIERWRPRLDLVDRGCGAVLVHARERPSHVFFPITAVVSMARVMAGGEGVEVAVIGREGFVGMPIVMGGDFAPDRATVRVAGRLLSAPARFVEDEMHRGGPVRRHLLRFASTLLIQVAHAAVRDPHCLT